MYIISHRGGSLEVSENTEEAIRYSLEIDVNGIEVDIYFTKDNIPIINHDPNLNRLNNFDTYISDINYDELCNKTQDKILSLEKTLEIIDGNKCLFIEIKGDPLDENLKKLSIILFDYSDKHIDIINSEPKDKLYLFMILSFNYNSLKYLSKFFIPDILMFLVSGIYTNNIIRYILHDKIFNNIGLNYGNLCIDNMKLYNNKNINIYLYTVNYENTYIHLKEKLKEKKMNINEIIKGFITDRPHYFLETNIINNYQNQKK